MAPMTIFLYKQVVISTVDLDRLFTRCSRGVLPQLTEPCCACSLTDAARRTKGSRVRISGPSNMARPSEPHLSHRNLCKFRGERLHMGRGSLIRSHPISTQDMVSFNSTLSACEKGNRWEYGLHFFSQLQSL